MSYPIIFRGADYNADHFLMVADVIERLFIGKRDCCKSYKETVDRQKINAVVQCRDVISRNDVEINVKY